MDFATVILEALESERFREWYEGEERDIIELDSDFVNYVRGDEGCKSREEILKDIKELFIDGRIESDLIDLCEDNEVMKTAIKEYFKGD